MNQYNEEDLFGREMKLESFIGQVSSHLNKHPECNRMLNGARVNAKESNVTFILEEGRDLVWNPLSSPKTAYIFDRTLGLQFTVNETAKEIAAILVSQMNGSLSDELKNEAKKIASRKMAVAEEIARSKRH